MNRRIWASARIPAAFGHVDGTQMGNPGLDLSGLVNVFYPLLNTVDGWLQGGLHAPMWRLCLWGVVSGGLAMGFYRLLSNQRKIHEKKAEMKGLRERMKNLDDAEYRVVLELSLSNLRASFALLAQVFTPAVLSSLPIVVIIFWLSTYYSFVSPRDGDVVRVELVPASHGVKILPSGAVSGIGDGYALRSVHAGAPIQFVDAAGGVIYEGVPTDPPVRAVHKEAWWNVLVGNEAGYLRPDTAVDEIRFNYERWRVIEGLPDWMGGWELPYFASLMLSALLLKVAFRIE